MYISTKSFICEYCHTTFVVEHTGGGIPDRKFCSRECYHQRLQNKINKVCECCGKPFTALPHDIRKGKGRFCSKSCSKKGVNNPSYVGKYVTVQCAYCHKEIECTPSKISKNKNGKFFCSYEHYANWVKDDTTRSGPYKGGGGTTWQCEVCGIKFRRSGYKKYRFCSYTCSRKFHVGANVHNFSRTESKCEYCGKTFEHYPSVDRRFCSHDCHEKFQKDDPKNNPTWKGGRTQEIVLARSRMEYKHWQKAVFIRDNWTCRKCGKHGGDIHAHHLYSFREFPHLRYSVHNGHTLCKSCHMKLNRHENDYLRSIGLDPKKPPLF